MGRKIWGLVMLLGAFCLLWIGREIALQAHNGGSAAVIVDATALLLFLSALAHLKEEAVVKRGVEILLGLVMLGGAVLLFVVGGGISSQVGIFSRLAIVGVTILMALSGVLHLKAAGKKA